jgi:sigma-B regulation protein RsbU (phosphoserine phosphatase)
VEPLYGLLLLALLIAAGALLLWLLRQRQQIAPLRRSAARLKKLAGFGEAILSAQLQLDALCEVVYQQTSEIIDTTSFQLGLFVDQDYQIVIWIRNDERLPGQRFPRAANEGIIGWVRKTGRDLLVKDYEQEWDTLPARPAYQSSQPARSALFAPLVAGGTTIGVIAIQNDAPHAYTADDLQLLRVLTNQAAGPIHNAQLFEQTQQRNQQLQLVSEVSQQITAMQPLADLFQQIVDLIRHTFSFYTVNIFTLHEKSGMLQLRASTHPNIRARLPQMALDEGLVGWVAARARTAEVADVTKDHRYLDDGVLQETRAEVTVPLIVERRVVGVLDVQSNIVNAFTHEDVVMLETLASQIALAIQEAETYTAERRQRERLNALAEASRAVVSILNIDDLLDEVIDLLTDYFGFDRTHIFLREGDRLIFRAGSGIHSGRWAIEKLSYDLDSPGIIARSVSTMQPIVCGDVASNPDYIPGPGVEDTQSEMVIPIRMGRQTLGALDIQSTDLAAFTQDDASLAEALADTMAIALRNATLYAREKRRRILAESLREVSMVLGASLEVDNVLNGILHGLERVINVDAAMIVLLDDDTATFRVRAVRGTIEAHVEPGTTFALDADIQSTLDALFHPEGSDAQLPQHKHLYVPLSLGDELLGYLAIDYVTGHFSQDDLEIINAFATQSAMAIANAQLYMAQREEAWVSTALLQVAESTARTAALDDVLQTVVRITPLLVGVEWCSIFLAQPEGFRIVAIESTSDDLEDLLVGHVVRPHRWEPLQQVVETGEALLLENEPIKLPGDITLENGPIVIEQGALLPLYAKAEIVGVLLIGQQSREEMLSPRKIELVGGIANQAALAIESAQLYAAQQEEAWVTTALLQVAEAVNAQTELTSSLETVVRLTPLLVGVERCAVACWDENRMVFHSAVTYGLPQELEAVFAKASIPMDEAPFFTALSRSTQPIITGDDAPYPTPDRLKLLMETNAVLGLPLITQGKLVGVMLVDHPLDGRQIDQRRMNILTGIASQTALAIETSRLQQVATERQRLEQELEVAQNIQFSFLPDTAPSVPGWDVAAYYRAARMVGGDFYDFLPLDDGRWGLVVADVADKGVPAALYMALSRTLLRAVARNRDDPAQTLLRVNKLLLEDTRSDLFVTMWYAIWDPTEGSVFYSSAGHNPPFVVSSQGQETRTLKLKGIALGVLDNIQLHTGKIFLEPGDTLVMYTDGVTEAINTQGSQFEINRLEEATRQHCHEDARHIIDAIIEALDHYTGDEPQFDDLTLVAIHCAGSEAASKLAAAAD